MRIAVDVCIGKRGVAHLRSVGHDVVVEAEQAESDREWFARALAADVELVIAIDTDIEILAYDHNVHFFRARYGENGLATVQRLIARLAGKPRRQPCFECRRPITVPQWALDDRGRATDRRCDSCAYGDEDPTAVRADRAKMRGASDEEKRDREYVRDGSIGRPMGRSTP